MIGQTIGHYRILEEIGRGGMGVVYRARDGNLRRDVALKLLPPSTLANLASRQRTRREALALSRLTHPAVAVIHDRISTPDCDCIVMEFVAGEPLDKTLSRGLLPEPEALRLGIQLAQGLAAAHTAGIIHRDLKPGNLRITPDGRLKILDFGLAKWTSGSGDSTEVDVTGSRAVVGTARYLAPELWLGKPASESSDLYAAGVILYEMASGLHPFEDLAHGGMARAAVTFDPPTPRQRNPALTEEFEAVILRCMQKDPARRISSAQELAQALEVPYARHRQTTGESTPARRSAPVSRRVVAVGGALLLVVAVIAVGVGQRWWGGVDRAPSIRSLAVLPLVNLSGDTRQDYFADGMTDELISNLSESSSLLVISRTSAMSYKGTTKRLPLIAQELGVDGIVQGSVQLSGVRVRISVQLIDGHQDRQLWGKHYSGDVRDALEIQGRVANSIAREIGLRLAARSGDARIDPVAYQLYLQGRFQWNRRNPDGIRRAIGYFNHAISRDSLYALAYCGLADAWATAGISGLGQPASAYAEAKRAALRAVALDPGLSEGYVSLANIQQNFDWDWDAAAR
jgi:serine/threonine protein kinase